MKILFLRKPKGKNLNVLLEVKKNKKYTIVNQEFVYNKSMYAYFNLLRQSDLCYIDKINDYPFQVSGVVNDCISCGVYPIGSEKNEYLSYIFKKVECDQITIEKLQQFPEKFPTQAEVAKFKERCCLLIKQQENENNEYMSNKYAKSNKRLVISFHGKTSTGGFLDAFRFFFNEVSNGAYDTYIALSSSEISQNIVPSHYYSIKSQIISKFYSLGKILKDKNVSYIVFVMPTTIDCFLLLWKKIFSPRILIFAVIHNKPNHISSQSFFTQQLSKFCQYIFVSQANCLLFLSKNIQKYYIDCKKTPKMHTEYYPLPCLMQGSENKISFIDSERIIKLSIVGRWLPYKSLVLLCDSLKFVKYINHLHITIAGDGFPLCELERLQKIDGLAPDNIIISNKEHSISQISEIMTNSNYVCFLYSSASQSGFLQLAKELRKPIICTNVGGLKENLINGGIGFCVDPVPMKVAILLDSIVKSNPDPPSYKFTGKTIGHILNLITKTKFNEKN